MQVELHLRALRVECGLTQAEVCDVIQHSEGFLSKLENGKYLPRLPMLARLARIYHCHPFDLLTFRNFPPPRLEQEWRCAACGSTTPAAEES